MIRFNTYLAVRFPNRSHSYDCSKLTSLIVSGADSLTNLNCNNTGIINLDITKNLNLTFLACEGSSVTSLDVSKNRDLFYLICGKTKISSLDVSNNPNITTLNCNDNRNLTTLTLSGDDALKSLSCYNTGITSLDVSNNPNLESLNCNTIGISSLDVSNNPNLKYLYCQNIPLAWLSIGDNVNLEKLTKTDTSISIPFTSKTFNIKNLFHGIDPKKVEITDNGSIDHDTGIVSVYHENKPLTYTYDCGTAKGTPVTLNVTLNFLRADSTITITDKLDMTYTGKPVKAPSYKTTGSKGAVTFTYEKWNGSSWEVLNGAPVKAGRYQVYAYVAEDDFNKSADSRMVFTIAQANNEWTSPLKLKDWTFGENANTPTAGSKFGTVSFTYSDTKNGTYTDKVPTKAGIWYVKATVTQTNDYTGLESIEEFTIHEQENKDKSSSGVHTGDNSQTGLLAAFTMMSAGYAAFVISKKRKKNRKEDETALL